MPLQHRTAPHRTAIHLSIHHKAHSLAYSNATAAMMPPMAPRPAAAVGRGPRLELSLLVLWASGFWVAPAAPPVGAGDVLEPAPLAVVLAAGPVLLAAVAQATSVGRSLTPTASQIWRGRGWGVSFLCVSCWDVFVVCLLCWLAHGYLRCGEGFAYTGSSDHGRLLVGLAAHVGQAARDLAEEGVVPADALDVFAAVADTALQELGRAAGLPWHMHVSERAHVVC